MSERDGELTGGGVAVATPPESEAPDAADADVKHVLLLDGVRVFLQLEQTLLQRSGLRISTAGTAAEAFDILAGDRVDLLITDYVLPDATGEEVVRRVREDPDMAEMGILVVTARGLREHVDRCMKAGCNSFLFKPVSRTELCTRVKELLDVPARRHVRTLVRLQVGAEGHDGFFFGNTVNLSESGVLLETDESLALGGELDLRFFLPGDGRAIQTTARVVRRGQQTREDAQAFGLLFQRLADDDKARIRRFVSERELTPLPARVG